MIIVIQCDQTAVLFITSDVSLEDEGDEKVYKDHLRENDEHEEERIGEHRATSIDTVSLPVVKSLEIDTLNVVLGAYIGYIDHE